MKLGRIHDHTRVIGKPDDWDDSLGECPEVFVRDELIDGLHFMQSAWIAEAQEVGWMLAGGTLNLAISAPQFPLARIGANLPPEDTPPVLTVRPMERNNVNLCRIEMFLPAQSNPPTKPRWIWAEVPMHDRPLSIVVGIAVEALEARIAELNAAG